MRIRWTLAAAADLEHIKNYLKEHNPDLAQPTVLKLYEAISMLQVDPMRFGWRHYRRSAVRLRKLVHSKH